MRKHFAGGAWVFGGLVVMLGSCLPAFAAEPVQPGDFVGSFDRAIPDIPRRNAQVQYDLDLSQERFYIHVPAGYTGAQPFGIIVFTNAGDQFDRLPAGWGPVLAQRKLLLVAAQNAGNNHPDNRRFGLAVLGAMKMAQRYKIDPQRVYAAGFSGGARVSGKLGFFQGDVFRGTIQCCGADFYDAVPQVVAKPLARDTTPYGRFSATAEDIEQAKKNVRFVLITGKGDFRYGNILDIHRGGFAKAGFQTKLLDVPGLGHEICSGQTLSAAILFIEAKAGAAAEAPSVSEPARPARPAWVAKDPKQWPPILLSHDARFRGDTGIQGASGFLMTLPNGAVVAATARHVLGDSLRPDGLKDAIVSWVMYPRKMPQRRVMLRGLAMDLAAAGDLDCLLMAVAPARPWPVEPLAARATPVDAGETVYLIAVPYDQAGSQNVYKGTVRRRADKGFAYEFEAQVNTRGFSGAPVIDGDGNAVGIHTGKYDAECVGGKIMGAAIDACEATKVAKAEPPPAAKTPTPVADPKTPATTGDKSPSAEKAASALQMAKSCVAMKRYETARQRLKDLIAAYPGTPAAKEAKTLLDEIEDKQ